MIDIEQINKYNKQIFELNEELKFYKNSVFVSNFMLFIIGNACQQIDLKGTSDNQFVIQDYLKYLKLDVINNIKHFTTKEFIQNFLKDNQLSIYFRIIHKFYNKEKNQDHYKIEFYYLKDEQYSTNKIVSFITEPKQFNLASFSQFLKTRTYEQKVFYQFNFDNMEIIQNNLLSSNNLKNRYLFDNLQQTSQKKEIQVDKKIIKV